jgi:hypothetical protein
VNLSGQNDAPAKLPARWALLKRCSAISLTVYRGRQEIKKQPGDFITTSAYSCQGEKMKRSLFIIISSFPILFSYVSILKSADYEIVQVTNYKNNEEYFSTNLQKNDDGEIVWNYGREAFSNQPLYLYDGSAIINLDDDGSTPQLNENGYVVWIRQSVSLKLYDGTDTTLLAYGECWYDVSINNGNYVVWAEDDGTDYEIFLYDGSITTQLTNNDYDDNYFEINDNGYVVWQGDDGSNYQLFLFDGSTVKQLSDSKYDYSYDMNNKGEVVWEEHDGSDYEIFLYNGSTITQLTNNDYGDGHPVISVNGYVVWCGYDGSSYNGQMFLFDGSTVKQLSNNHFEFYPGYETSNRYKMNDNGEVAWREHDGLDWEILFYDGSTVKQLTDNEYDDYFTDINDNGYVVWTGDVGSDYIREVFLFDGSAVIQITDNDYDDRWPEINNNNVIAWIGSNENIFYAIPSDSNSNSNTSSSGGGGGGGCFLTNLF